MVLHALPRNSEIKDNVVSLKRQESLLYILTIVHLDFSKPKLSIIQKTDLFRINVFILYLYKNTY